MESDELKSSSFDSTEDARIESWLRRPGRPINDNGFSNRVLLALPEPRRSRGSAKTTVCFIAGSIGVALAGWKISERGDVPEFMSILSGNAIQLQPSFPPDSVMMLSQSVELALVAIALSFAYIYRDRLGQKLQLR